MTTLCKKIKRPILVIILVLLSFDSSQAQLKKVAQSGMPFLKIGVGARMAGRGETGIAAINDIDAIFWNPAGLALMRDRQILFTHNRWIADIAQNAFAFGINLEGFGTIGASLIVMDYGTFYPTVRDPEDAGLGIDAGFLDPAEAGAKGIYLDSDLAPVDLAVGLAYARQFTDRFQMGWHVKIVHENLGTSYIQRQDVLGNPLGPERIVGNKTTNVALDFGTVYRPGFAGISFAMAFQNFGSEMKYQAEEFPLPLTFKIGISMEVAEAFKKMGSLHDLVLSVDTIKPNDYTQRLHLGAEYVYMKILSLRAGYKWNYDTESLAAGFGVKKQLGGMKWAADVSYTKTERFTSPLRFSLAGQF